VIKHTVAQIKTLFITTELMVAQYDRYLQIHRKSTLFLLLELIAKKYSQKYRLKPKCSHDAL